MTIRDGFEKWCVRLRRADVRLLAAIGAGLLLIVAIAVTLPKASDSDYLVFDPVPPGRDISHAKPIDLQKVIEANIVGGNDSDFYRVKSLAARGYLKVHISNASATLIPGVRIYAGDKKPIAEYSLDHAGTPLDYAFPIQPDTTYYLQVWGANVTAGTYTLAVTQ